MKSEIQKIKEQAIADIQAIKDSQQLADFKAKYFDKQSGAVNRLFKDLKSVAADLKPQLGVMVNDLKTEVEGLLSGKIQELGGEVAQKISGADWIDPTVSNHRYHLGHLHPMTQMISELEQIFSSMGFWVLNGPELESDFYNFEALNIPSWHPARESQDTFYVEQDKLKSKILMRTQTSDVQIRAMQKYGAPLRMIAPGRVFRNEATDASHEHTFYQIEGLMIDENISISNLIAVLKEMVSAIFKKEMQVRLRPGYFPFVEPGFELDMSCTFCNGQGCVVCKHTGWIEMGGSGLVHPNVLKAGGIDPEKYSGFAFGMGITRLLMLKYGIDEIRLLQSGDLRFLRQF